MPRSKSSSCVHENADCNCKLNTYLFKRKVISEHERSEWHTVAMSMVLLLMHITLLFKLGGLGLSFNPIELPLCVKSLPNAFSSADDVRAEQLAQTAAAADPVPEPIRVPEYGGSGTFAAIGLDGKILGQCPLKHTSVVADVNDGIARVSVTQKFHNPFHQNIQAVYAFPLDEHCAVESMRMLSGKREIVGSIKPRAEAAEIYRLAAAEGRATALLEEERPNIFTQSVANVSAGEDVSVTLNYSTVLVQEPSHLIAPNTNGMQYGQRYGYIGDTYTGIKRFYANDIIGNLFQNVGQLIGKWISEWVNGYFADTVKLLMYCIEALILNPFFALRGICNPAPHFENQTLFFYIRSAIDLVYGVVGGFLLLGSLSKIRQSNSSDAVRRAGIFQCSVIALLLIAGPWIYRVVFQLTDVFVSRTFVFDPECTRPVGDALCSALKGGLMAGAGLLAHAFAPLVGGVAGGLALGPIGETVALVGLIVYCCISIVLMLQLLYMFMAAIVQSFLFTLSIIAGPIAFACGGTSRLQKFSAAYVSVWIDLILWLASSVVLITSLRFLLFSDLNPWFKILLAMCNLQAMIFAPLALSYLRISPMSKYMGLNPIQGLAAGITQVAKMASDVFSRFSTPR